ncbi:MAG: TraR/DksA family transcriptional regulator [Syntrophaceae bacterium]|nr:TraR/DksA family transcriptional regulator [Syntrophaceae bacterium]
MATSMKGRQERLKKMLLEKNREFEAHLKQELGKRMKEGTTFFASTIRDEGDLGYFGFEQEISRRQMISCTEKLKRIAAALERLQDSTYGVCEECGGQIGEKRLLAMPFTAYCLECQQALEDEELSEKIRAWTEEGDQPREV